MNLNKVMCWESANKGLKIKSEWIYRYSTSRAICYDK
jgi:hypothetical protein